MALLGNALQQGARERCLLVPKGSSQPCHFHGVSSGGGQEQGHGGGFPPGKAPRVFQPQGCIGPSQHGCALYTVFIKPGIFYSQSMSRWDGSRQSKQIAALDFRQIQELLARLPSCLHQLYTGLAPFAPLPSNAWKN